MPPSAMNKTMDRDDLETPELREIVRELDQLIRELYRRGLTISSWYGRLDRGDADPEERMNRGPAYEPLPGAVDDGRFPWFLYWEIAWVCAHTRFVPGQSLLDLGGCSSLFAYYLASRGVHVTAVDLDTRLVSNGNHVAEAMGWPLENVQADIRDVTVSAAVKAPFDHVTSICVFEHIPLSSRLDAAHVLGQVVRPGGSVSLTFDYQNPAKEARIDSPAEIERQFVAASGLRKRGNPDFADNGKRYLIHPAEHPDRRGFDRARARVRAFGPLALFRPPRTIEYTFGALFLERV